MMNGTAEVTPDRRQASGAAYPASPMPTTQSAAIAATSGRCNVTFGLVTDTNLLCRFARLSSVGRW